MKISHRPSFLQRIVQKLHRGSAVDCLASNEDQDKAAQLATLECFCVLSLSSRAAASLHLRFFRTPATVALTLQSAFKPLEAASDNIGG